MLTQRVLCLNASYEPITTVHWHRAVILVLAGEAEAVEEGADLIRSQRQSMQVPTVIRLAEMRQVPFRARTPLTRRGVLARDGYRCCYCTRRKANTIDHVRPRSKGGRHRWENVVASCSPCNARKADLSVADAGLTMAFQPSVPSGITALVVAIGQPHESWLPYLGVAAA